jgi:hypothetical protein
MTRGLRVLRLTPLHSLNPVSEYNSTFVLYTMLGFLSTPKGFAATALLLASTVSAAGLGIKNAKVAVTSSDGLSDATYT